MTQERAKQLFIEVQEDCRRIGIPVQTIEPELSFKRANSWYGYCNKEGAKYQISLSTVYLSNADETFIRNVLMHECVHTVKGCMNHGKEWKKWCKTANEQMGYSIELYPYKKKEAQVAPDENVEKPTKYVIECTGCGQQWFRTRRSRLTEDPHRYFCRACGTYTLKVSKKIGVPDEV